MDGFASVSDRRVQPLADDAFSLNCYEAAVHERSQLAVTTSSRTRQVADLQSSEIDGLGSAIDLGPYSMRLKGGNLRLIGPTQLWRHQPGC